MLPLHRPDERERERERCTICSNSITCTADECLILVQGAEGRNELIGLGPIKLFGNCWLGYNIDRAEAARTGHLPTDKNRAVSLTHPHASPRRRSGQAKRSPSWGKLQWLDSGHHPTSQLRQARLPQWPRTVRARREALPFDSQLEMPR